MVTESRKRSVQTVVPDKASAPQEIITIIADGVLFSVHHDSRFKKPLCLLWEDGLDAVPKVNMERGSESI